MVLKKNLKNKIYSIITSFLIVYIIFNNNLVHAENIRIILDVGQLNNNLYYFYQHNIHNLYLRAYVQYLIDNRNNWTFNLYNYKPVGMQIIPRKSPFIHPFLCIDVLNNPYNNWSINFEFTHNNKFDQKNSFDVITSTDVLNTHKPQFSSNKFYLFKNCEMNISDYNYSEFDKFLKRCNKNGIINEQICKEYYMSQFNLYLNKK